MAFLRVENKKSGKYLRIVQSYRENGKVKHKTLHSLGKVEDYPPEQLEAIANKLLELAGKKIEKIIPNTFHEIDRVNYGYSLVIKKLWQIYQLDKFAKKVRTKVVFDWEKVLQLLIAERLTSPESKLQNYYHQHEYFGLNQDFALQHFYRTLDILSEHQDLLKKHIFNQRKNLFTQSLDVVFYDVTTLYFDSQKEIEGNLRQKGYSKDGKAHKVQIVLGLLVDKLRNPITYQIYKGNTYEGSTMIDALSTVKNQYKIDRVIVVADSGMIDKVNRDFMTNNSFDYILGERLKSLPKDIQSYLIDKNNHRKVHVGSETLTYSSIEYKGRKIICTYSEKRARKDAYERQKLLKKAMDLVDNPGKYNQIKKRGAGRFIKTDKEGSPILDTKKIELDAVYDGFKAIATTTDLDVEQLISKYGDLFEVEHAFRTLKSQLEIRPVFHWTNRRIEGHIALCFLAYSFFNYLRNLTQMQYKEIVKTLDKMQLSVIDDGKNKELIYMRSRIDEATQKLIKKLKLVVPNDITPQSIINQYFT